MTQCGQCIARTPNTWDSIRLRREIAPGRAPGLQMADKKPIGHCVKGNNGRDVHTHTWVWWCVVGRLWKRAGWRTQRDVLEHVNFSVAQIKFKKEEQGASFTVHWPLQKWTRLADVIFPNSVVLTHSFHPLSISDYSPPDLEHRIVYSNGCGWIEKQIANYVTQVYISDILTSFRQDSDVGSST